MGIFVYVPASFAVAADPPNSEKSLCCNDFSVLKNYVYFLVSFSSIFGQLFVNDDGLKTELLGHK